MMTCVRRCYLSALRYNIEIDFFEGATGRVNVSRAFLYVIMAK